MRTVGLIVRVLATLAVIVVGWVAYDYAAKFFDQALRLVYKAAPAGGKTQIFLHSNWTQAVSWGEWAIITLLVIFGVIILRRVWGR